MAGGLIKVAVVGASGYAGGELVRLLLGHGAVRLAHVFGLGSAGMALAALHPGLRGLSRLTIEPVPETKDAWPEVDVIFLSLPHGESMGLVPRLPDGARVIDLSGDFRVKDGAEFARYYGFAHQAGEWHQRFVYGLSELARDQLRGARLVANPGCFATACLLALAPLARHGLIEPDVVIDAKTGSSGSGAKPSQGTHHPERADSFTAYKPFRHQHLPEIREALAAHAPGWAGRILLQTHSAPMVRGIFASLYARLVPGRGAANVAAALEEHYGAAPFVRRLEGLPNVRWVRGSNFADLGFAVDGRDLALFAAIDNLGKGAAGQAVQNMNLMLGLDETMGLWHAGILP